MSPGLFKEGQEVWVSKYALSEGLVRGAADRDQEPGERYAWLQRSHGIYVLGRDVHLTRDAAVKAAEAMRTKKIASLRKQIAKLEKLSFAE